jgi:hypothetical protein
MPRESSNEKLLPFTTRWSTSAILHDLVNISRASLGFIGGDWEALSGRCFRNLLCAMRLHIVVVPIPSAMPTSERTAP